MLNHQSLVERAGRGERGAVDELLVRHLPALLAYVRLRAGSRLARAESSLDFVHATCLQALESMPRFEGQRDETCFKRWLFATVERKMKDRARRLEYEVRGRGGCDRTRWENEADLLARAWADLLTPSRNAAGREELERVEDGFGRLPEKYRRVILETRLLGRPAAELVPELAPTPGAVRVLLHRALARLSSEAGLARHRGQQSGSR